MNIVAADDTRPEIRKLAEDILSHLDLDLFEEAKAAAIREKHETISEEDYLDVWLILDAPTRRAWKEYLILAGAWTHC